MFWKYVGTRPGVRILSHDDDDDDGNDVLRLGESTSARTASISFVFSKAPFPEITNPSDVVSLEGGSILTHFHPRKSTTTTGVALGGEEGTVKARSWRSTPSPNIWDFPSGPEPEVEAVVGVGRRE